MDYREFIQSSEFDKFYKCIDILPKKIFSDSDYLNILQNIFKEYQEELDKVDFSIINVNISKNRVRKICEIIIKSIEWQLNGNSIEAINTVKKLFNEKDIGEDLFSCILEKEESNHFTKQLYRGRVGEDIFELSEIFHVPFNKRQYVATERYSIPGYPCLYLSGSIYGSWLELNKPHVNNFYVSRYEVKEKLKVLDLSLLPREVINGNLGDGSEYLKKCINGEEVKISEVIQKYIYTWPIICACSFIIDEKNRFFKSEYVLPQLLLQVIRSITDESDKIHFDGIKYFSVKCKYSANVKPNPIYINYVFISDNKEMYIDELKNEYSKKLCRKFKLTPPANAYMCMSLNTSGISGLSLQKHHMNMETTDINREGLRGKAFIEIMREHIVQYNGMDFYRLEELLCNIPARDLD